MTRRLLASTLLLVAACSGSSRITDDPDATPLAPDAAAADGALARHDGAPDASPGEPPAPLPVLVIDTAGAEIVQDDKIAATMYVVEDHDGSLDGIAGRPHSYDGHIGIEIRGNTSASFDKHSYGVETRDDAGDDADVALLGLPADSDWVLYAPYNDKTFMRDKLAYDLGRAMGRYQPRARYVELIVNGQYDGVYVVIEKIKRGADRVDIPKVAATAAGGDISGGYIIKREGSGDGTGWDSAQGTPWDYHYPKAGDVTADQRAYLADFIDRFEAMMSGDDFNDPERGYATWLELPSFIDYVIVTELSRNVDGYRKSAYFSKDRDSAGGRLHMGPLWDYNIAFGNADYCSGQDTAGFQFDRDACGDVLEVAPWWTRLSRDPGFASAVRCRWQELRGGILSDASLDADLDGYRTQLAVAEPRDHQRWPVLGTWLWPNPFIGKTYDDEVGYLRGWIHQRAAWMDGNLPGTCAD